MNDYRKAYCINCDEDVDYITKLEKTTVTVKDKTFDVLLTKAYCKKCGEPVFPAAINKANDIVVYDGYRKLVGLLTSEQIKEIRRKRNLSQTEFAKLLNCGEKNIARYETGTIQDKAFDLLMRLADNDQSYKVLRQLQGLEEHQFTEIKMYSIFLDIKEMRELNLSNGFETKEMISYEKGTSKNGNKSEIKTLFCN